MKYGIILKIITKLKINVITKLRLHDVTPNIKIKNT